MNDLISRKDAVNDVEQYIAHIKKINRRELTIKEKAICLDVIEVISKLPNTEPLTEEDYIELRDRFGEYVEFVVRDMITRKEERWK